MNVQAAQLLLALFLLAHIIIGSDSFHIPISSTNVLLPRRPVFIESWRYYSRQTVDKEKSKIFILREQSPKSKFESRLDFIESELPEEYEDYYTEEDQDEERLLNPRDLRPKKEVNE